MENFVTGMYARKPHPKAPSFVKCTLSLRRVEMIQYLQSLTDENVNIQILESKAGDKWYAKRDNYQRQQTEEPNTMTSVAPNGEQIDTKDIPF